MEPPVPPAPENQDKNWCIVICKFMGFYWRGVFLMIWPFVSALCFLLGFEKKFGCLFIVVLMAGYWVTECIPLYVTGMLPVVLLPFLGIQDTASVCVNYLNKTNWIFMGSIMIALGIEYSGLHYRIAYCTILCMGCSPRKLHLGLTVVTMLLSMFLTNSACTAMMCPILNAVLLELDAQGVAAMYKPKLPNEDKPRPTNTTIAYFLTAAYASTIGGIGTLVGTATNLTYKGLYETRFPDGNTIEFLPWFIFNVPPMLILAVLSWLILEVIFMGFCRPKSEDYLTVKNANEHAEAAKNVIRTKMTEMGKCTWNEKGVLLLFSICIFAWFLRKPQFMPGWGDLYDITIADATPAITVVIFFVAIPGSFAFFDYCTKDRTKRPTKPSISLVPWSYLQQKFPWGLLFLLGGGFAIADAGKQSGMSKFLGEQLGSMKSLHPALVLAITAFFAEFATELTSNVAICNIVIPILMEMSVSMEVHPVNQHVSIIGTKRPTKPSISLVPWSYLQQKFPWGLLFLLGGGFAIADAGKQSGMSKFLGEQLGSMKSLHPALVLAITAFFAEFATELTSNVAICNIVIPILMEMSVSMEVHPVKLTFVAGVMCSFAFLLPVGTPPNAIASEYANIKTTDMVKGGILIKLSAWLLYVALFPTYGALIYDQKEFPDWATAIPPIVKSL